MMRKLLVIAGILIVSLLVVGCIRTGSGLPAGKLTVIDHALVRGESGNVTVQVTVKNTGSAVVELAKVTVSFYDDNKSLIDSSSDSVLNLRPGETWDFEIACQGTRCSQVKSYEIESMAGTSSGGL